MIDPVRLIRECPIGWDSDGKLLRPRSSEDADVVAWVTEVDVALRELIDARASKLELEDKLATESVRAHAEYKARRNEQFAAYEKLTDRIATIADEGFGPFPVQTADQNLSEIERGIADQHARITNACIKFELLRDDIGGCERPVLDHDRNRWTKTIDEIGGALGTRKEAT